MTTHHTPYDGIVPYTRTVHNRVEGYRQCQADYAPLLEAAKAVEVAMSLADFPSSELIAAMNAIERLRPAIRAAIAAAERQAQGQ